MGRVVVCDHRSFGPFADASIVGDTVLVTDNGEREPRTFATRRDGKWVHGFVAFDTAEIVSDDFCDACSTFGHVASACPTFPPIPDGFDANSPCYMTECRRCHQFHLSTHACHTPERTNAPA